MTKMCVFGLGAVGSRVQRHFGCNGFDAEMDLADQDVVGFLARQYSLVVNCLPAKLGFSAARTIMSQGAKLVDVTFMEEDPKKLDTLALDNDTWGVFDVGIAPGLSDVLIRALFNKGHRDIAVYVGGNPAKPKPPLYYKSGFHADDVAAEYTRPARLIVGGHEVAVEPLSMTGMLQTPFGEQEYFVSDGLRGSLSIPAIKLAEFTLRWPGHLDAMKKALADGYVPAFEAYGPGESEVIDMQVFASGEKGYHISSFGSRALAEITAQCTIAAVEALVGLEIPFGTYGAGEVLKPEDFWHLI